MINIHVTPPHNLGILTNALSNFPNLLSRAVQVALKRTIKSAKQAAARKVAQRYTIRASSITNTIKVRSSGLSAQMSSRGSRNPLEQFNINPRARLNPAPKGGIHAEVIRGQGGDIHHAFIKGGGVFERVGRARFPLRRLRSVAAPQALSNPVVSAFIVEKIEQRLGIEIEYAANSVIGGWRKI